MPESIRRRNPSRPGRYAYDRLERVFHEKARLGIVTSLMACPEGLAFRELRGACALTDGNLARHLQVLSDSGYVEVRKEGERGRPHTMCRLTALGRERFADYLGELEQVIKDAHASESADQVRRADASGRRQSGLPPGWVPA